MVWENKAMTTYVGGKKVIGKEIAQILMLLDPKGPGKSPYWEPFVGMCGVMQHITAPVRLGSDLHHEVISMWQSLQDGWIPPVHCSESEYLALKNNPRADPALRAYIGHGFSYCGTYFGAYKPKFSVYDQGAGRRAFEGALNTLKKVRDVHFFTSSYDKVPLPKTPHMLIYCDPPYAQSTSKVGRTSSLHFDNEKFWDWVRQASKHHTVVVSETQAPPDFVRVWNKPRHLKISLRGTKQQQMDEGLFIHQSVAKRLGLNF